MPRTPQVGSPKRDHRREPMTPALRGEMQRGVCRDERAIILKTESVSCRHRSSGPGSPSGCAPRRPARPSKNWAPREGKAA
jgi:hypothetical protein